MSEQPQVAPAPESTAVIRPRFHHVNLKTRRLDEMIEWYGTAIGMEVTFRYELGAWLSNDEANHRLALLAFPDYVEDPYKESHTGMHHTAWEYDSLDDLLATYERLKGHGIVPFLCFDHGMTLSMYYSDPDGNHLEFQIDVFGDWAVSKAWMLDSLAFRENPLGVFFDPDQILEARRGGLSMEEIHERAFAGRYLPDPPPDISVPPIPSDG